jgi:transposase
MFVHKDARNFGCDECAAKFKRKDDLKVHMKIHLPADIRAVEKAKKLTKECETCGKKFEKNWKLKRHMVVHTKDSNNAFVERAVEPSWHSSKVEVVEVVVPEEQMFIVLNDAKSVRAESLGSYSDV